MTRQWLGLGIGVIVGGLVVGGLTAPTEVKAALAKTATQVEVVNFPQVQGVAGTVNVGNLPAVQGVEVVGGEVTLANLPVDGSGNLRVAEQACQGSVSTEMEVMFTESDRVINNALFGPFGGVFPPIELPAGYRTVSIAVMALDLLQVGWEWRAGFLDSSAPSWPTPSGPFRFFPLAQPLDTALGSTQIPNFQRATFKIAGSQVQIVVSASGTGFPPDTRYFVHLYLTK